MNTFEGDAAKPGAIFLDSNPESLRKDTKAVIADLITARSTMTPLVRELYIQSVEKRKVAAGYDINHARDHIRWRILLACGVRKSTQNMHFTDSKSECGGL